MTIFGERFAVALVFVMYSYSGWNAAAYITGEIKKPEKNVPRSLLAGTGLVIVIYVLLNAVFLTTTPIQELKGQIEIALIAGKHIFGTNGGRVAGAVICLGLVSAISSMTWVGPRVTMSMGEDHWLLRRISRKNSNGIPTNAILLQLLIVNVLLLTRSFESVMQYAQFSSIALLAVRCGRRDCLARYASGNRPALPGLGLSGAPDYFQRAHHLDDVLSVALEADRIAGRTRHCTRWRVVVFLRAKTPATLTMKKRRLRKNEPFRFAERTESGAAERALQNPSANRERKLRTRFGMRRYSAAFVLATILVNMFSVSAQQIPQVAPRAIPVAPTTAGPNDIARFLAGMPVPENSPLAPLTRDPAWQAHSAFFEGEFSKLFQRQLQKLHAWTATNFPEVTQPTPVAFYMFSGPDFFVRRSIFP